MVGSVCVYCVEGGTEGAFRGSVEFGAPWSLVLRGVWCSPSSGDTLHE